MHFSEDDGGRDGLVFAETSWQRRRLRGSRDSGFAASLCLASHLCLLYYFFFPVLFFIIIISPRVCETEKCLLNCCAAPWLWSCMSTLWAPISATMTGTWLNDWHPAPMLLTSLSLLYLLTCNVSVPKTSIGIVKRFIHRVALTLNEQHFIEAANTTLSLTQQAACLKASINFSIQYGAFRSYRMLSVVQCA